MASKLTTCLTTQVHLEELVRSLLRDENFQSERCTEQAMIEKQIDILMNTLHPGSHDQTISSYRQLLVDIANAINQSKQRVEQLLPELAKLRAASENPCYSTLQA